MKKVMVFAISICLVFCISACGDNKLTAEDICKSLSSVQAKDVKLSEFSNTDKDGKEYYVANILSKDDIQFGTLTISEKDGGFEGLLFNMVPTDPYFVQDFAMQAIEDIGINEKSRELIKEKMLTFSDANVMRLLDSDGYGITSRITSTDSEFGFIFFVTTNVDLNKYEEGNYQEIKSE